MRCYKTDQELRSAICEGSLDKLKIIIDEMACEYCLINQQYSEDNETPLMLACRLGNLKIIEFLLEHDADPNIRDRNGSNAFDHAHEDDNVEIINILNKDWS